MTTKTPTMTTKTPTAKTPTINKPTAKTPTAKTPTAKTSTTKTRTTPTTVTATIDSPIGALTIAVQDGVLTALHMHEQRHFAALSASTGRDDPTVAPIVAQLDAYFAGELTDFDLPLALHGTAFQRRVWAALREIPYGETISYGELARWVGNPKASRAVGLANGRNPVAIVVPCHRVIAAGGGLGGYGGGLERKTWLLQHEGAWPAAAAVQGQLAV